MKQTTILPILALTLSTICWPWVAAAQPVQPTAVQARQLSVFGALVGDYTGISGGKNLGIAAGIDLGLRPWLDMRPTLEARGVYPIDRGTIASQKDGLGGLRLDFYLGHRLHPYVDFLFGRGEMNYAGTACNATGELGYVFGNNCYQASTTYVYSPGAGFDYDIGDRLAIKVDGQVQHWASVPTASGTVYSNVGSIGLVYRFGKRGMP